MAAPALGVVIVGFLLVAAVLAVMNVVDSARDPATQVQRLMALGALVVVPVVTVAVISWTG